MRRPRSCLVLLVATGLLVVVAPSASVVSGLPSAIASLPDTVTTGQLYLLGNKIEPSYAFDVVRDSLYVNGILVFPYRDFMEVPADSVVLLDMRAQRLGAAMSDSGRTDVEITEAIANMYRSRPDLFSEVVVTGVGELVRTYLSTGRAVPVQCWSPASQTGLPQPSLIKQVAAELEYITYGLRRGAVVFVGVDGTRGFEGTPMEEYPLWVLKQLESPGSLRRLGRAGAEGSLQP